ncbi:MAG: carboxypeptidase regulatory-like domain-containing protein [Acidobacteria bacterium]|nr:carboxypeptidase regulatory-like domain-containing protein [Acidobacteriota bacterium]
MTKRIAARSGLFVLAVGLACAQTLTSLNGVVSDPSGAVVPNATVELINVDTNSKRDTATDASGSFAFQQVNPGNYRLSAKATGFSSALINDIRLLVGTPATVNIKLEVGSVSDTISISSEALQLNTVDASVGNAFGTKPILQMPFEARNVAGLLSLQPGVTFAGSNVPNSYRGGNVNGGKNDQANVTLDGVDVNDQQDRDPFTSVLRMTLDSVQEFRVVTTNANAELGRSSGAQISLVTRSGTNDVHGAGYWFVRNKATNANSFFNNQNRVPLAKLNRNIYGARLGGPIKKNKLFLFGNYEGRKDRREDSVLRTVPTASLREGSVKYIRTDGSIATLSPADLRTRIDTRGIGPSQAALAVLQRYPLPNDSAAGDAINTSGFRFNAPVKGDFHTYIAKLDYVIDSASKHNFFVRGNLQDDRSTSTPQFPGQPPNDTGLANTKGLAFGLTSILSANKVNNFRYGITRVGVENTGISNLSFVTFRTIDSIEGTNRAFIRKTPVHTISDDFSWTKNNHDLKFGGVIRAIRNSRNNYANSFPSASANASWLVSSGNELNAPLTDIRATARVSYRDAAMAVLGLVSQGNARYNYNKDGSPLAVGAPVVRQFNAEEYEMYVQDTWKVTKALTLTYGLRWSLMPPIYEANGIQTVARESLSDFFDQRVALASVGAPQFLVKPVEYVLKEQPGGRDLYPFHKKNVSPRFALAYSPQGDSGLSKFFFGGPGRSVIRAGWGQYYDVMGSGLITNYDASALGLATALTNPSAQLSIATAPRFTGLNSIPNGLLLPAPPAGFPQVAPNAFAITNSLDDKLLPPYTMNMNLNVGREFHGGLFVQVGYVGRLSRRSLISEDISMPTNLKDPASGVTYFEAATQLANLANANTPIGSIPRIPFWENIFPGAATATRTASQNAYNSFVNNAPDYSYALYEMDVLCRPACSKFGPYSFYNRQYSYLRTLRSIGSGSYHSMQFSARKRFKNADQVDFNYTFSKSMDLASRPENSTATNGVIINAFDRRQFRAVSDYDATHQWNANFVYGLPVGRGRALLDKGGVANAVFGGWQLSGLYRQSTGLPTSVGNGRFWPTNWNVTGYATPKSRPVVGTTRNAPAPPGGTGGVNLFPNPDAAIKAYDYTLPGQAGSRNSIRGDGNFNIDLGLAKSFDMPWKEGHSLQFRWEVFNATNSVRFDPFFTSADLGNLGSFGKYTDTLTLPRVMQFGLRYDF